MHRGKREADQTLSDLQELHPQHQSLGHDVFRRFDEIGIPTFAFINGLALGGGLEVGLHCNYRTLSATAFTALPEVFLGLVPGWGGATIVPKLIGPERAVQVIIGNASLTSKAPISSIVKPAFSKALIVEGTGP